MNIAEAIKKCACDAIGATIMCDVVFGKVIAEEPFRVQVGELVLEGDVLTVPEGMLYRDFKINHGTYEKRIVINEGIKEGDVIALMRKSGGGNYIAFAKL